ncbi:MAG: ABC transporter substrate-binding protein [Woeseiaceae bacterium]|nr:ABC transporter substrate-binding protein [Woeseiaceae bacterium]
MTTIVLGAASVLSCTSESPEPDRLAVGGFSGLGAATDVAHAKGFFTAEGIRFEFDSVDSSEELMTNLIEGRYDIIQTNADNIIAWTEGQGADGTPHDFVMVLGGYRGREPMELVVAGDIRSVDDLRGKVLAVDAVHTGYAPMLVYMLRQEGLVWKEDYELESVGGGPMRAQSLKAGRTTGGLVELDEELEALGFHVLMSSSDYIAEYARGVTAARRDWAEANADLLVRYIRAMVRSINWLLDPANRAEAVGIIMAADRVDAAEARLRYEEAVDPVHGFVADAELRPAGIEQILKIREVMGAMSAPLPPPEKYIEDRYYRSAMQSLDR